MHRLAPAVAARLLGVVLCVIAVLILLSTLAIAVLDLHTLFLLVPVALTFVVLVGCWWTWREKGWVVRFTDEGYRVQWVRGVGAASARWKDVEDAVTTTVADAPVVVLRLRDGAYDHHPCGDARRRPGGLRARRPGAPAARSRTAQAVSDRHLIRRGRARPCNLLCARPLVGQGGVA